MFFEVFFNLLGLIGIDIVQTTMSVSRLYLFPFSSYMEKKNLFLICLQSETRFLNYKLWTFGIITLKWVEDFFIEDNFFRFCCYVLYLSRLFHFLLTSDESS